MYHCHKNHEESNIGNLALKTKFPLRGKIAPFKVHSKGSWIMLICPMTSDSIIYTINDRTYVCRASVAVFTVRQAKIGCPLLNRNKCLAPEYYLLITKAEQLAP